MGKSLELSSTGGPTRESERERERGCEREARERDERETTGYEPFDLDAFIPETMSISAFLAHENYHTNVILFRIRSNRVVVFVSASC